MKRPVLFILYLTLLAVLAVAHVRSAWLMPLRNFPFDFSINYTGARLIAESGPSVFLYDRTTLAVEAGPYTEYPLYTQLFLTYIQTPLTAVILLPISGLSLDDARLTFLAVSNLMLIAAAAIVIYALRPTKLLIATAFFIFATYEAMFDSLRLGQVDGLIVLLLALSFLALRRGRSWLIGAPLAGAAILKLSPAIVIGFFAWQRNWRAVAGAVVVGAVLLGISITFAGWDNHRTFVEDISPRLSKGSTLYDNVSVSGALARGYFGEAYWYYEDEVPDWPPGLRAGALLLSAAFVVGGYILGRKDVEAGFMLSCATAVLVSPIAWSFYPVWLVPSFLFLVYRFEQRRAWSRLALLAALYPMIAIVPAHFTEVDPEIYRYPIKTIVLVLYWALLAWEAQTRLPVPRPASPCGRSPAIVGARS